jgi:hypothetical protein
VAIIFLVLWTALYVALLIYIVLDVLMQTRKYAKNSESKELAEISSKGSVLTIEGSKEGLKDASEDRSSSGGRLVQM